VSCGQRNIDRQTDGQRDMTKLTVAVSKFANAPNNCRLLFACLLPICLSLYLNISYVLQTTLLLQKDTKSKDLKEKFLLDRLPITDTEFSRLKIEALHVVLEESSNHNHF
jgi:hypothetical protein